MDVSRTLDDRGFERLTISTPKMKASFIISKANNGYSSYEVNLDTGKIPKILSGWYTTPDKALDAVKKYLRNKSDSSSVKRDRKYKKNHATAVPEDDS